jgi:anthranilate synthase component 1
VYGRSGDYDLQDCALPRSVDLRGLHRLSPERYPFLLQSTASGSPLGRYDILFASPGPSLELLGDGTLRGAGNSSAGGFLAALDEWWQDERRPGGDTRLPFTGGWFLFLGYELAAEIEPTLSLPADTVMPTALAVRCRAAIIVDHHEQEARWIAEADAGVGYAQVLADIDSVPDVEHLAGPGQKVHATLEEPPQEFLQAVASARDYIAAGDIYQANLSRGWSAEVDAQLSPDAVYAALCNANPAPFAGLARWHDKSIISSSPERLVEVRRGAVATRPIAGTRPRSTDSELDASLSRELFAHPKERAEHIMLIDLERNDLGRICKPGTVEVDEMMALESYAHVHHIVSNVRGLLRPGVTPGEVIRAVFPGGTITGCPKVRCMEIIAELERRARGAYTGSFGYLNRDGSLDLNILIRTMVMQKGMLTLRAGCGIVADSEPEAELAETRAKAAALLEALGA